MNRLAFKMSLLYIFLIFSFEVLEAARAILPNVEPRQGKPGVMEK